MKQTASVLLCVSCPSSLVQVLGQLGQAGGDIEGHLALRHHLFHCIVAARQGDGQGAPCKRLHAHQGAGSACEVRLPLKLATKGCPKRNCSCLHHGLTLARSPCIEGGDVTYRLQQVGTQEAGAALGLGAVQHPMAEAGGTPLLGGGDSSFFESNFPGNCTCQTPTPPGLRARKRPPDVPPALPLT